MTAAAQDPIGDTSSQWRAERMQLVNWGGFEGHNVFDFHPGSNLISGASGTGKSTLLDAYLALMMPPNTRFNGASNDADSGRARTGEQRSLLSYLRGQVDTTADPEDGTKLAKQLRGNGSATWGAISMTFVSDTGQPFTAMRIYYVPARASSDTEILTRMQTMDSRISLADLEQHVGNQFAPAQLRAAYPTLRDHKTHQAFGTTLHTRLGIGANGDGAKAMQLLVRIQAGHQIRTVDELYKDLVLERPGTYEAADAAVAEFDNLEAAYQSMRTEEAKATLLAPITDHHATWTAAEAEMSALDTLGINRDGLTPLTLWSLQTEARLLTDERARNADRRRAAAEDLREAQTQQRRAAAEHKAAIDRHRAAGGGTVEQLDAEIARDRATAADRQERRRRLDTQTQTLEHPISDRESFDRLAAAAAKFLDTLPAARAQMKADTTAAFEGRWPLLDRRRILKAELESLATRQGRIPKRLDDLRVQAAEALGLTNDALPFVGELLDVLPEHAEWRTAIETVLGGEALVMLVPVEQLDDLSAALDPLRLRGRLRFQGVSTDLTVDPDTSDPARIAGKLAYKQSPFSGWVAQQVASPAFNALCVHQPHDLDGPGYRVTAAGQTRRGKRGAHGSDARPHVIGFSNRDLMAEMAAELDQVAKDIAAYDARSSALDEQRDRLEEMRTAYEAINGARWDDYDVESALDRVAHAEQSRANILAGSSELADLSALVDTLATGVDDASRHRFAVEQAISQLTNEHGDLIGQEEDVHPALAALEANDDITLSSAQSSRLDEAFSTAAAPKDPNVLSDFTVNRARMLKELRASHEHAERSRDRAAADLTAVFAAYKKEWDDPNLSTNLAAYPDFAAILDSIVADGLHTRHADWRRRLTEWSGQDLVPLNGSMERAISDIQDRLDPINDILKDLPFGRDNDRLSIHLRAKTTEHVAAFRRQLKDLSRAATVDMNEEQLDVLFTDLQAFMERLRFRRDDRRGDTERDKLLDVRRHVEITAQRFSPGGTYLATYDGLGGKSGGETQELTAFIVGAALRFRLGDGERTRFAPVFLDEGFVKSDSEFAGRAVRAWQDLGFQLIVGAPLDKVTSLEPHMDQILAITKDPRTYRSFVTALKDPNAT
jgi:uncharacterized protein YPO0396